MQRSKEYRRHQKFRARSRAERFCKMIGLDPTPRQIHRYEKERTPCSCGICRNEKYNRKRENEDICRTIVMDFESSD